MRCAIPSCGSDNRSSSGISFHRLPEVRFLYAAWEKAFSEAGLRLAPGSVICSKHFLDKDLFDTTSGRQLRSGALPIVNEVCRICFSMDCKLYSMTTSYTLNEAYEKLTGLSIADEEHLPRYLCRQCANSLMECDRFRSKSLHAHVMMLDVIRRHGAVTVELIQSVIQIINPANSSPSHNVSNDLLRNGQLEEVYSLIDARGDMILDDTGIYENIVDIKTEIDYAIDQSVINGDDITNDDVDEVKTEIDDLNTSDNVNASNVDEDIDVDVVTNAPYDAISQDDRSVCPSNEEEDVVVDDEVENVINAENITNEEFINEETNKPLVYSAGLYEYTVGNVLKITLGDETDYRRSEEVSNNYIHSFVFIGEDVLEDRRSQARELTSLPTRVTEEKNEDHQPPHGDGGPSIGDVLRCDLCSYRTVSDIQLLEHLKAHAAEGSFMCDVCGYKATSKNALGGHMKAHSLGKMYSSKVSKKMFNKNYRIQAHTKTHLDEPLHSCDVCNKTFKTKRYLSRHVQIHLDLKPFTCQICDKGFKRLTRLQNHLRIHTGEKPYSCDVCKRDFYCKDQVKRHMWTHCIDKPYSCDVCGSKFFDKYNLRTHMMGHLKKGLLLSVVAQKQRLEKLYCKICNKLQSSMKSLDLHTKTHTVKGLYSCDVCNKLMNTKSTLNRHLKIHYGETRYRCDICNKLLPSKEGLNDHMKSHSGQKFPCEICNKLLNSQRYLLVHLKKHSGQKLPCSICNKLLSNKHSLKLHLNTHSDEKPFSCDVCKRRYRNKVVLFHHIKKKHLGSR